MIKDNFFEKEIKTENVKTYEGMRRNDLKNILEFINSLTSANLTYHRRALRRFERLGFSYVKRGVSGYVFKYRHYAIKIYTKENQFSCYSEEDARILNILKGIDIYPKLYADCEGCFSIREFIEGDIINSVNSQITECKSISFDSNFKENLKKGIAETLERGIIPEDLNGGNVVIDKNGKFKIIDVGSFVDFRTNHGNETKSEIVSNILDKFDYGYCSKINAYIKSERKIA